MKDVERIGGRLSYWRCCRLTSASITWMFFFLSSIPKDISNHLRAADGGENTKRNNEKVFKKPDELQGVGCKLTPPACSTKKNKTKP